MASSHGTVSTAQPSLGTTFSRGEQWVWFSGAALAGALILIAGLMLVILLNGGSSLWPRPLTLVTRADGPRLLGVVSDHAVLREANASGGVTEVPQTQFKVANRDVFGADYVWLRDETLTTQEQPENVLALERQQNGDFFGTLVAINEGETEAATGEAALTKLQAELPAVFEVRDELRALQRDEVGRLNADIRRLELAIARAKGAPSPAQAELDALRKRYAAIGEKTEALETKAARWVAVMETADGRKVNVALANIVDLWQPNRMSWAAKLAHAVKHAWWFVSREPRESNQEGGVFPALFGTVMMTLIMTLACTPLGVITALYLREYAKQGLVVRLVRIAVNNLAGVPSIVFGVFGLGFFVYFIGGNIDRLFYPEALPNPTWGTGGILWASLTLALLTVPVVIVAAEEAIAAVPRGMREGSLALGASKFQTITRIVLPGALPGILTGVILAMARGAGEVAPLMITGVVKLAPELPFDGVFPFFHLDRKFMHLGFHIYDVGFQSPNVEASKPMVFTTTLLLMGIVVALNLAAIRLRNRIRRAYQTGAF